LYPASPRCKKAALRWLIANANQYNIDTNYITVGGGYGAIMATTLGITNTITPLQTKSQKSSTLH
jgi:acetyl esterase/lipase